MGHRFWFNTEAQRRPRKRKLNRINRGLRVSRTDALRTQDDDSPTSNALQISWCARFRLTCTPGRLLEARAPPLSPTNLGKMSKNSIPGHARSLAVRVPLCRHRPDQIPPHFKFFQLLRLFLFLALGQEVMIRLVKF